MKSGHSVQDMHELMAQRSQPLPSHHAPLTRSVLPDGGIPRSLRCSNDTSRSTAAAPMRSEPLSMPMAPGVRSVSSRNATAGRRTPAGRGSSSHCATTESSATTTSGRFRRNQARKALLFYNDTGSRSSSIKDARPCPKPRYGQRLAKDDDHSKSARSSA